MTITAQRTNTSSQPRTRSRALAITPALQPVAPAVVSPVAANTNERTDAEQALRSSIAANVRANRYSREAEAAKKALNQAMQAANLREIQAAVDVDGVVKTYKGEIVAQTKDTISVAKLRELVDDETFMKIVTATKTAVVEHCGSNMAVTCTTSVTAPEALSLREVK